MKMTVQDALSILNITYPPVTRELIKENYRRLASKYHPDKNPNGLRLMQDVNVAYDRLSTTPDHLLYVPDSFSHKKTEKSEKTEKSKKSHTEPDECEFFRAAGLYVWKEDGMMWVDGKTFNFREILKSHHYRWNPDKKAWWKEL